MLDVHRKRSDSRLPLRSQMLRYSVANPLRGIDSLHVRYVHSTHIHVYTCSSCACLQLMMPLYVVWGLPVSCIPQLALPELYLQDAGSKYFDCYLLEVFLTLPYVLQHFATMCFRRPTALNRASMAIYCAQLDTR